MTECIYLLFCVTSLLSMCKDSEFIEYNISVRKMRFNLLSMASRLNASR